jgi:hypothetical protein
MGERIRVENSAPTNYFWTTGPFQSYKDKGFVREEILPAQAGTRREAVVGLP